MPWDSWGPRRLFKLKNKLFKTSAGGIRALLPFSDGALDPCTLLIFPPLLCRKPTQRTDQQVRPRERGGRMGQAEDEKPKSSSRICAHEAGAMINAPFTIVPSERGSVPHGSQSARFRKEHVHLLPTGTDIRPYTRHTPSFWDHLCPSRLY